MGNPEHLALLQQGVAVWNEWRKNNPTADAKLGAADLNGAKLEGANLDWANLNEASLREANLDRANLSRASLSGANLRGAHLIEANLRGASLDGAKLEGANLDRADLSGAGLRWADLSKTDLSGANLDWAKLRKANLSEAKLHGAILSEADLSEADLSGANLDGADLRKANLKEVDLHKAASLIGVNFSGQSLSGRDFSRHNLCKAIFNEANLSEANLREADLREANLRKANLEGADVHGTNLSGANTSGANLNRTELIRTDFSHADLTGSSIYGIAAWDVKLTSDTRQENLIITPPGEPVVMVDNIKVAQFIYLLLHNEEIRDVIDTVTSKAVLILGRFSKERKVVLDALREELRKHNYLPILFDFDVPENRDITETVSLLARMARFIIADLTDPSSIPKELEAIVPSLAVPVQPLLEGLTRPYAMFKDYWKYNWVLPPHRYEGLQLLLATLAEKVIAPAEAEVKALEERRRAIELELTAPRS